MSNEQSKTTGPKAGVKKRVMHDNAIKREAVRIFATGGGTIEDVAWHRCK